MTLGIGNVGVDGSTDRSSVTSKVWRPVVSLADLPVGKHFIDNTHPGHLQNVVEINPGGVIYRDQQTGEYRMADSGFYQDYFKHFKVPGNTNVTPIPKPVTPSQTSTFPGQRLSAPSYTQSFRPAPPANPVRDFLARTAFNALSGNDDLVKQLTPEQQDTSQLPMPQRLAANAVNGVQNLVTGALRLPFEFIQNLSNDISASSAAADAAQRGDRDADRYFSQTAKAAENRLGAAMNPLPLATGFVADAATQGPAAAWQNTQQAVINDPVGALLQLITAGHGIHTLATTVTKPRVGTNPFVRPAAVNSKFESATVPPIDSDQAAFQRARRAGHATRKGKPAPVTAVPGNADISGEFTRIGVKNVHSIQQAFEDTFGYSPQLARDVATEYESIARGWAQRHNRPVEDWYTRHIAGITKGGEWLAKEFGGEGDEQAVTDQARFHTNNPTDARMIVAALSNPDESAALHELGHVFLRQLEIPDRRIVRDWLRLPDSEKWTIEHEEQFVDGFERWFLRGKAPNASLAAVFSRFRNYLGKIYRRTTTGSASYRLPAIRLFNQPVMTMLERYHGDVADITGEGGWDGGATGTAGNDRSNGPSHTGGPG